MSLETAAQIALRERARQEEFTEALEARHGKDIAWIIRQHAMMLYVTSSMAPPEEFFIDPRVAAIVEAGRSNITTLISESVNVLLCQFVLKRDLTEAEAKTYASEIQLTLNALMDSENALLKEFDKP